MFLNYKKFLIPSVFVSILSCALCFPAQAKIPTYYMGHYEHAKVVLQQEYPAFLTAFEQLQKEVSALDSSHKQAQHDALMRFFPSIETLASMDSFKATPTEDGVAWDLQLEVVVSFFAIDFPLADGNTTNVHDLLFDSFKVELAGGDAVGILSEKDIMKKHNMSQEEAQRVRSVLHRLYSNSLL